MKLYQIEPVPASFIWRRANRGLQPEKVELTGIWLGTRTAGGQQTFVPVVANSDPTEDWWGVCPSMSNRPKICANRDSHVGWIARLSSKGTGDPIRTGEIVLDTDAAPLVYLVARGRGTSLYTREEYPEALITAEPGATVSIVHTDGRFVDYIFGEEEVTRHPSAPDPDVVYITLNDPRIPHWNYDFREKE